MPRRKSLVSPRWLASGKSGHKAFVNPEKSGSVYMLEFRPPCNTEIPRGHLALLFDFAGASEVDNSGSMTSVNGTFAHIVVPDVSTRQTCLQIRHVSSAEEPFYISPASISRCYNLGRLMRFPLDSPSDWCESVMPVLTSLYRHAVESDEELGEGEYAVLFENEIVMVDFVMPTQTEVRSPQFGVDPEESHGPWWDNSLNCMSWCRQVVKSYSELSWPSEGLCAPMIWPGQDLDLYLSQGIPPRPCSPGKESTQNVGDAVSKTAEDAKVEAEQSQKGKKNRKSVSSDMYAHSDTSKALQELPVMDVSKSYSYEDQRIDEWSLQWPCCGAAQDKVSDLSNIDGPTKPSEEDPPSSSEGRSFSKLLRRIKRKLGA